jgi:hypothetical protein
MSDKVIANERRRSHRAAGQGDLHEAFLEAVRARDDAHNETERLRARVEVLETALRYYADDAYNGYNANGACARAALETKP